MPRMFGGAEISLQGKMVELLNNLYGIRNLLGEDDWLLRNFIMIVKNKYANGLDLDDKPKIANTLNFYYNYFNNEVVKPGGEIWAIKYGNDNAFKELVRSTLEQIKELIDELNPGAYGNAMNQDGGGSRRKTRGKRSRKSKTFRNSRRRRRLSKRKSSKRK